MPCPTPRPKGTPAVLRNDEGSVTIEAAVGLASIIVVAVLVVSAMSTLALHISAVDMAGAAARAAALGQDFHPKRGSVSYHQDGLWVTATVMIPAPIVEVSATATYPVEILPPERREP